VIAAGQVPPDGPVRLGQVQLSEGRRLPEWDASEPLLWATSTPVPGAGQVWQALNGLHHDTGLVPILLAFLDGGHQGRPWDTGEIDSRCDLAAVDRLDAASVLAQQWASSAPTPKEFEREPELLAGWFPPFGLEFPGLAPGQDRELTSAELAAALRWFGPARIGLVPAARPADVLAQLGFNGTANGYGTPELLSAVLRSWEDRFGAVLIEVGYAHIRMLVRRPPRTLPDAQGAAGELYIMCDEFWPPGKPAIAVYDVRQIAEHTLNIPIWSMWWD
jgi:hypothetical protein